jgi:hypothetical protein
MTATLFAHGLQTRSELELGLGHRIAAVAGQAGELGLSGRSVLSSPSGEHRLTVDVE